MLRLQLLVGFGWRPPQLFFILSHLTLVLLNLKRSLFMLLTIFSLVCLNIMCSLALMFHHFAVFILCSFVLFIVIFAILYITIFIIKMHLLSPHSPTDRKIFDSSLNGVEIVLRLLQRNWEKVSLNFIFYMHPNSNMPSLPSFMVYAENMVASLSTVFQHLAWQEPWNQPLE